jgi:Fe2+ or Zn2+ uptake regulation protein
VAQRAETVSVAREYRNTVQRAEILDVVREADGHLTAGEIFERARRRDPKIAYGTVYRTLDLLARHGLIQELTFADQASRYDKRVERHDHVYCVECGVLVDVDVPVALIARHVAGEQSGFAIDSHHTMFSGLCPPCRHRAEDATRTGTRRGSAGTDRRPTSE